MGIFSVLVKDGLVEATRFPKDHFINRNKGFISFMTLSSLIVIVGYSLFMFKAVESHNLYAEGYNKGYVEGCNTVVNYFGTGILYYDGIAYSLDTCLALAHTGETDSRYSPANFLSTSLSEWQSQIITVETQYFYDIGERTGKSRAINNLFRDVPALCYGVDCVRIDDFYSYDY